MVARRAVVQLPAEELLIDGEERNPGISWPLAVDRWLENRLTQARKAGMATSRKELACALMTAIQPDDEELVNLLRTYRRRSVGDLLALGDQESVIEFQRQKPGPRSRRAR
jgi:hypothetical protein